MPYFWLVSTSFKEIGKEFLYPPQWIPDPFVWRNYVEMWNLLPFARWFLNTAIIVALNLIGATLSATMAGYAFAKLRFPGRNVWFAICLATMMMPGIVVLIPQFILYRTLGWVGTNLPLWVPSFFGGSAFAIFLSRQFFMTIPYELDEAARIDGASSYRIWWSILMPLSGPVVAALGILLFQSHWNEFLGPLIYLPDRINMTLSVGLRTMLGLYSTRWNLLMAASVAMTLPIIVIFFAAQRHFIRGIVTTGLSGR
ncbi:MAG: carbohydrate ABC transporter permease [Chloroflexi bacterium]|nr:carbohydrate ABC transporter permease [Chloroflexota bacterium]